eukprot:1436390-Amphidinium_carterae.3
MQRASTRPRCRHSALCGGACQGSRSGPLQSQHPRSAADCRVVRAGKERQASGSPVVSVVWADSVDLATQVPHLGGTAQHHTPRDEGGRAQLLVVPQKWYQEGAQLVLGYWPLRCVWQRGSYSSTLFSHKQALQCAPRPIRG